MDSIGYLDELIKEYLLFRGYIKTYTSFTSEKQHDRTDRPDPSLISEQLLNHVRMLELTEMIDLWQTLTSRFFIHLSSTFAPTVKMMEQSLKRAYIVKAVKTGDRAKVTEFYDKFAVELTAPGSEWEDWFILPYLKDPTLHPRFAPYFHKRWFHTLALSLKNFLTAAFQSLPLPKLMAFNTERNERKILQNEIKLAKNENEKLKKELAALRQNMKAKNVSVSTGELSVTSAAQGVSTPSATPAGSLSHSVSQPLQPIAKLSNDGNGAKSPPLSSASSPSSQAPSSVPFAPSVPNDALDTDFTDPAFSLLAHCHVPGHPRSTVTRVRFSIDGSRLATAGKDGSMKLWSMDKFIDGRDNTLDPLATFPSHASELTCFEWDSKNNSYLAIGSGEGKIRMLGVESRKLIGEMDSARDFPVVVNLATSPTDKILVSSTATKSWASVEAGKGMLDAWDLTTCKRSLSFTVDSIVSQINSLTFNHNGNMLVSGGADGMVRIYDMTTKKPIMGWPAHQGQVTCVRLCSEETTVISAGLDGRIIEWSLHRIGKVVRSFNLPSVPPSASQSKSGLGVTGPGKDGGIVRGELSLDAENEHFALSSSTSLFAPSSPPVSDTRSSIYAHSAFVYSIHQPTPVQALTGHTSPVMTIDWHPTLPIVATGAQDGIRIKIMKQIEGRANVEDSRVEDNSDLDNDDDDESEGNSDDDDEEEEGED